MTTKRIFIAIKILINNDLQVFYNVIKNNFYNEKINWVDLKNLHITLKFYGDTDTKTIEIIKDQASKLSNNFEPFYLKLQNLGFFGSRYNPKVLWIGVDENKVISNLASNLCIMGEKIGFETSKNRFLPHLTLCRIKYLKDIDAFNKIMSKYKYIEFEPIRIDGFQLYESILHKNGTEYVKLHEFM